MPPPIVPASVFHCPGEPGDGDYYGRVSSPSWRAAEAALELLEGAPCVLFPSGMAAITALFMTELRPGDTLLLPSDGYYNTRVFAEQYLQALGVTVRVHPTATFAEASLDQTRLVLAETPSNPGLEVCDLAALAERCKAAGSRLAVDNTTATAIVQPALDLGADVVVAADTKAPGGHSDVLVGHLASRDPATIESVRRWRTLSGSIPGPFDAYLLHRGLSTLEVRLERMSRSAEVIAARLAVHPAVRQIRYPGLPDDPAHALARRQMSNYGFLIGFDLGDETRASRFLSSCTGLIEATSFGGVHTTAERRARWGDAVAPGYIRLSVGCEPVETLWETIATAL